MFFTSLRNSEIKVLMFVYNWYNLKKVWKFGIKSPKPYECKNGNQNGQNFQIEFLINLIFLYWNMSCFKDDLLHLCIEK